MPLSICRRLIPWYIPVLCSTLYVKLHIKTKQTSHSFFHYKIGVFQRSALYVELHGKTDRIFSSQNMNFHATIWWSAFPNLLRYKKRRDFEAQSCNSLR